MRTVVLLITWPNNYSMYLKVWEFINNEVSTLGIFNFTYYSNDHLPPTLTSDGHELFIDLEVDFDMYFHARYYSSSVAEAGNLSKRT